MFGYSSCVIRLHWTIIFALRRTPLLWTLTMLRMRAIALCAHNAYSANHDDRPTTCISPQCCVVTDYPSKDGTLTMCWFNVGPPSATLGQHWTNTPCLLGCHIAWNTNLANTRHDPMLDQCWTSVADAAPTLNQHCHGPISCVCWEIATVTRWQLGEHRTTDQLLCTTTVASCVTYLMLC